MPKQVALYLAAATAWTFASGFVAPPPTHGRSTWLACGGGPARRHPIYWIEECAPHNKTRETAARSARNLASFLTHKGVAPYNVEAFDRVRNAYAAFCTKLGKDAGDVPLLLDSCCGTGRSTWNLAKSRPEAFVVGVDKSFARLTRNAAFRGRDTNEGWGSEMERGQGAFGAGTLESTEESEPPPARDNMILVRANCIDFWRLIWESGLDVESHTLLYPNPYPKPKQHMLRWHGSPSFPILLYMGAPIEVRAVNSWRTYLEEMAIAVDEICGTGPLPVEELIPGAGGNMGQPLSNFEIKYVKAKQPVFRLSIPALPRVEPPLP